MPQKGEKYVCNASYPPSARVFVTVTRVAKDNAWADCRMETGWGSWSKRMPLIDGEFSDLADMTLRDWNVSDLDEAQADNIERCLVEAAQRDGGES